MKKILFPFALVFLNACNMYDIEEPSSLTQEAVESPISESVIESLYFMREEEKLARDVYDFLFDTWGQTIFQNISSSENQHMQAVKTLIDQFGLEDPIIDDARGSFENAELQYLYDSLIMLGSESLTQALAVGALIEEVDIENLDLALALFTQQDVVSVYENLNKGSRNHLRSFYQTLLNQSIKYEPQVLNVEYFDTIVTSDKETGKG